MWAGLPGAVEAESCPKGGVWSASWAEAGTCGAGRASLSNAARASSAVGLSSTGFASIRPTSSSHSGASPGRRTDGFSGVSYTWLCISAGADVESKGGAPVSISYTVQPSAYTSVRPSSAPRVKRSGAM